MLFVVLFLTAFSSAQALNCPNGVFQLPPPNVVNGSWPNQSLDQLESIVGFKCSVFFSEVPRTIVTFSFNMSSIEAGQLSIGTDVSDSDYKPSGTGVAQFTTPWNSVLTIDGSKADKKSLASFAMAYSYVQGANQSNENTSLGKLPQSWEFTQDLTASPGLNPQLIAFLAYHQNPATNYMINDRIAFFNQNQLLISGNQIVKNDKNGVSVLTKPAVTLSWSPKDDFQAELVVYSYPAPPTNAVDWTKYSTKTWEGKNLSVSSNQPLVLLLSGKDVVGVMSNLKMTSGTLIIYLGITEFTPDGRISPDSFVAGIYGYNQTPNAPSLLRFPCLHFSHVQRNRHV
ncbi:unnamed protein product [Caenorhabditis auriculariae]|uniref:CUB-like domain-containing protein n=1 Tax=Caenorhabditis auriculariae TaxID=2777116 RepID=A0A8S1HP25_9PELO|nr:unnamed protein product [Caenorhabditis auriculariae]